MVTSNGVGEEVENTTQEGPSNKVGLEQLVRRGDSSTDLQRSDDRIKRQQWKDSFKEKGYGAKVLEDGYTQPILKEDDSSYIDFEQYKTFIENLNAPKDYIGTLANLTDQEPEAIKTLPNDIKKEISNSEHALGHTGYKDLRGHFASQIVEYHVVKESRGQTPANKYIKQSLGKLNSLLSVYEGEKKRVEEEERVRTRISQFDAEDIEGIIEETLGKKAKTIDTRLALREDLMGAVDALRDGNSRNCHVIKDLGIMAVDLKQLNKEANHTGRGDYRVGFNKDTHEIVGIYSHTSNGDYIQEYSFN